jgi:hypothetical protein
VDAGEDVVWHAGIGVRGGKQIRGRTDADVFESPDNQTAFDLELAVRAPRAFATGEFFWMTDEQQNPLTGPDLDSSGFHVQGGYMVLPATTEVGVRYARVEGNTDADDAAVTEVLAVVSYYWRAHNLKLQADAGPIRYGSNYRRLSSRARSGLPSLGSRLEAGDLTDVQIRVQMQVAF